MNFVAFVDKRNLVFLLVLAVIVVAVLLLTSQTYAEVPVLLLTFITAMILNMGLVNIETMDGYVLDVELTRGELLVTLSGDWIGDVRFSGSGDANMLGVSAPASLSAELRFAAD